MDFGSALNHLKAGGKVTRSGWNGAGLWLELQRPDENSKMTLPYIYINYPLDAKTTPGAKVPWLASQTDMLADDWVLKDVDDEMSKMSLSDLLNGGGSDNARARAINSLSQQGIKNAGELLMLTRSDLLRFPNLGRKSIDVIISSLSIRGIALKGY